MLQCIVLGSDCWYASQHHHSTSVAPVAFETTVAKHGASISCLFNLTGAGFLHLVRLLLLVLLCTW